MPRWLPAHLQEQAKRQERMIITVSERKERRLSRLRDNINVIRSELADYGREHGGRFVLFGSIARGDFRYNSDIDILVDFPSDLERQAWRFAETLCTDHSVLPDIHLASETTDPLMSRIVVEGVPLP